MPEWEECINKQTPYLLTDINKDIKLIFYQKDGKTYCFEYADIEGLLQNSKNPYTRKNLPEKFLNELRRLRETEEYKQELEKEDNDENIRINQMKTEINTVLNQIDPYISVDQFLTIIKDNPDYSILPATVDINDNDAIVRYLYNNRTFIIRDNNLAYLIVKFAFNEEAIHDERISENDRTALIDFNTTVKNILIRVSSLKEQILQSVRNNDTVTLRRLRILHGATANDVRTNNNYAFRFSSKNGYINILKELREGYGLNADDARAEDNYALRWACMNGHLEVVKYLIEEFELTVTDARAKDNWALRGACSNGHLEVVKYLIEEFELTVTDARAEDNFALRGACSNGHLEIVKYLKEEFALLTADDARANYNYALRYACAGGHLNVVKYLRKEFNLTTDDARAEDNWALRGACRFGHFQVVKYLREEFRLTDDDARANDNFALRKACQYGHLDVVKYLREEFGLTAEECPQNCIGCE